MAHKKSKGEKPVSAKKTTSDYQEGLYFIPLGGSEQFGINLNTYICDGQILIVDCGIGFADEYYPGIDLLLPDPTFLEERQKDIAGLIITHAHEDHIGAVPYLYDRLHCPIYASPFTAAILRRKFEEFGIKNVPITVVKSGKDKTIGPYKTTFVHVAHSIPDACALIIETPHGNIVHSGDWNLDPRPITGAQTDPKPFKDSGKKGVLAYIGDSTNAEVLGMAGSESDVETGLEAEFRRCEGRIVITMFSSNIGRVISIARAAQKVGRKVCVIGRSLHRMIGAARECGYMNDIVDFVEEGDIRSVAREEQIIIATGSQGEYRAALARMARGDHRTLNLQRGDTVIFSAREIPGNDRDINTVKNNLSAGGVTIITPSDTENIIHVSGHPCRGEIEQMFDWLRPNAVIPVHGERTQLDAHARLARSAQISSVVVPSNGAVIEISKNGVETIDHVETGILAVDQKRIIPGSHQSISGRRKLQYTGVIHVSLVLDDGGKLLDDPMMDTIGLIDDTDNRDMKFEDKLYDEIEKALNGLNKKDRRDDILVEKAVRQSLRRLVSAKLGFKPKTTIHVLRA